MQDNTLIAGLKMQRKNIMHSQADNMQDLLCEKKDLCIYRSPPIMTTYTRSLDIAIQYERVTAPESYS